jgi:hypothetical protein
VSAITREQAKAITADVEAAVAAVFAQHGLEPSGARTSYGNEYTVKLSAIPVERDEAGINRADPKVKAWADMARYYGLPEDGVGRTFKVQGHTYTIIGLAPGRPRRPVIATDLSTGKPYVFAAVAVKDALERPR